MLLLFCQLGSFGMYILRLFKNILGRKWGNETYFLVTLVIGNIRMKTSLIIHSVEILKLLRPSEKIGICRSATSSSNGACELLYTCTQKIPQRCVTRSCQYNKCVTTEAAAVLSQKKERAYFKVTRFLDVLIFEPCLFSSHAYLKDTRFLDVLIFKTFERHFYWNVG